jgi:hypothetical protein
LELSPINRHWNHFIFRLNAATVLHVTAI